jgi:hypothetical protein
MAPLCATDHEAHQSRVDLMPDGLIVLLVSGFFVALMFGTTWKLLGKIAFVALMGLKFVLIVGLVFGATNCQQFYDMMGWTPVSLLFGDRMYMHRRMNHDEAKDRRTVTQASVQHRQYD